MNSRDLVIKALNHEAVERVPRDLWRLPGLYMNRSEELNRLLAKFPKDFAGPEVRYGTGEREKGEAYRIGKYIDAWGSVWNVAEDGVIGEVKEYPLDDWSKLAEYKPPYEVLETADFTGVNKSCAETEKFVLAGSQARLFERIQFLRGSENVFIDLACGTKELFQLIEMVHDFEMRDIRKWAETDVDGVSFMDDWGAQSSLLISPKMWRNIFKPLYKDYCDILREHGKYAFFHSDGYIEPIYKDLIEIGVHAVNSQLFCMDIEEIGNRYRGRITFWGEIDRQHLLPFGTVEEVREGVRRVRRALDRGNGGVIAQCEWGKHDPYENIEAVYDEWLKPIEGDDNGPRVM